MTDEALKFAEEYGGIWSEHHKWLVSDWQIAVAEGETRQSYWDWVLAQIDLTSE